jgi:hypothetical protein
VCEDVCWVVWRIVLISLTDRTGRGADSRASVCGAVAIVMDALGRCDPASGTLRDCMDTVWRPLCESHACSGLTACAAGEGVYLNVGFAALIHSVGRARRRPKH